MDADLCEEKNPPAAKRRGEFSAIEVPSTKQDFQQWTAGLDRESVREAPAHIQALNGQQERKEHARKLEAERLSSSCAAADTEQQCG